jgi:hypothetical protein
MITIYRGTAMHIIFKKNIIDVDEKYIVLDLDTFQLPDGSLHTACCVVENVPILELAQIPQLKELHTNLMLEYGKRNWNYCEQAIDHLTGKWGGEMDSFYMDLKTRIDSLKDKDLDDSWSPVIPKS